MSRSPDSLSNVATLFAGSGSASNSSSSVDVSKVLARGALRRRSRADRSLNCQENVGFRFVLDRTVQTLSKTGVSSTGTISGLLFVPSLAAEDPCNTLVAPHIPSNVTRLDEVSEYGYPLIGFAPWVSADCTQSFLAASREQGTDALIFFQPSSNDTGIPPPVSDGSWALEDGDKWRTDNHYPVYAISGPAGVTLMRELSWFSDAQSKGRARDHSSSNHTQGESERLFAMVDSGKSYFQLDLDIPAWLILRSYRNHLIPEPVEFCSCNPGNDSRTQSDPHRSVSGRSSKATGEPP